MYERTFGTDWSVLDRDEVLLRAFAIGVAESLGEEPSEGELDRLKSQVSGRYGQSMVDLAYDEGRTKGRRASTGTDADAVWTDLVESGEEETVVRGAAATDRPARQTDLPDAVSTSTLPSPDERDDLARFRLPEFLR